LDKVDSVCELVREFFALKGCSGPGAAEQASHILAIWAAA
jgi:hypothetical protein